MNVDYSLGSGRGKKRKDKKTHTRDQLEGTCTIAVCLRETTNTVRVTYIHYKKTRLKYLSFNLKLCHGTVHYYASPSL
jgi:hypothetical protein